MRDRFEELFLAHRDELLRFAVRRVGPDSAADVVSETFLVAWRRLADVSPDNQRAWLFATARHVISNDMRSTRRASQLASRAMADATTAGLVVHDHGDRVTEQQLVRCALGKLRPGSLLVIGAPAPGPDAVGVPTEIQLAKSVPACIAAA